MVIFSVMYKLRNFSITFCSAVLIIVILYNFQIEDSSIGGSRVEGKLKSKVRFFDAWHECMKNRTDGVSDHEKFWKRFESWSSECDKFNTLGIIPLQNTDETKYALLPLNKYSNDSNILVTLGIGKDIEAEKQFRDKMEEIGRKVTFYGADPITDVNAQLYSTIGDYFPFAVGGDAGFQTASVFVNNTYINQRIAHIDIIYFLDKVLKLKTIDHLWVDAEYAEYGFFDILYNNGRFDENAIKFCQMNMEVHNPNDNQKKSFMEMIKRLLLEKRYGFLRNRNFSHMRMFLFNFDDDYCVLKFIRPSLFVL